MDFYLAIPGNFSFLEIRVAWQTAWQYFYKVLNDSLGIRILEVNYKPCQSSGLHAHPDLAAYVNEGAKSELTDK